MPVCPDTALVANETTTDCCANVNGVADAIVETLVDAAVTQKFVMPAAPVPRELNPVSIEPADNPPDVRTPALVGAPLKAVIADEALAVCTEPATNATDVPVAVTNTGNVAGAALNAVIAAEVEAVRAEPATKATDVPVAVTNTGRVAGDALNAVIAADAEELSAEIAANATLVPVTVANAGSVAGAALNAVIAAEAEDVNAEAANNAADVPLAVKNTDALVGVAVNTVRAELPVPKDEAADREPDAMFVTALAVSDDPAFAPQTESVQLVLCAAHESK